MTSDRCRWVAIRWGWLLAPLAWVLHAILHLLGIAHVEGAWWWL